MKRKVMAFIMAVSLMGASSGAVLAKSCKGVITKIEGKTMVIEIKGKCKCKVGDTVKIKPKKSSAVEGC